MCSETLNKTEADEIWMTPCGWRPDKQLKSNPEMRLAMCEAAIKDYFPQEFPVQTCDYEVKNGESIPTCWLLD